MPVWHQGWFVIGVCVSVSSAFSVTMYRPSKHTGPFVSKIDVGTSPLNVLIISTNLPGGSINSFSSVKKLVGGEERGAQEYLTI